MSNFRIHLPFGGLSLLLAVSLAGCIGQQIPTPFAPVSPPAASPTPEAWPTSDPSPTNSKISGWLDWDGVDDWNGGSDRGVVGDSSAGATLAKAAAPLEEAAAEAELPPSSADVAMAPIPTGAVLDQQQPSLKAGMVDDNVEWDDYLLYRLQYAGPTVHDRDISERYVVTVADAQDRPLLGAQVTFLVDGHPVYEVLTYATGQVLFFPRALGVDESIQTFDIMVEKDDARQEITATRNKDYQVTTRLDHAGSFAKQSTALDVLFLIDATGSMGDEIGKLQSSIQEISARIDRLPGQPDVRFGMTIYRDREDAFVTRTYDFTPEVAKFSEALDQVTADGGGDTPESLNEGLYRAIHAPEWRNNNTIKLLFLVADAPPHLDYDQDYDYAQEMQAAAERGIKIFSIASSGLDDQGEYVFRQIAQFTQGRFIFLTYGPAGEPGDSTTHHVDDYSVESLDDLVVRLVEEELAYQE